MCRWAAYLGKPIYLQDVISAPDQSLLQQSLHARESKTETNGDGFGIALYGARRQPGVYRDVLPAWADANLASLAHQIRSGCFLAHVRASTGTATSRTNCHPFTVGKWSFMHNGQVGGFDNLRRRAEAMVDDQSYRHRLGTTDSEVLFLLAMSAGLDNCPKTALERAAGCLERLSRECGATPHMRMTVALSDGKTLYAARYASDRHAPSLYVGCSAVGHGHAVVSEPLGTDHGAWQEIPPGRFLTINRDGIRSEPFRPSAAATAQT